MVGLAAGLASSEHAAGRRALLALATEHRLLVSEVCDYELRRELIPIGASTSLRRLDEVSRELVYVPVTTTHWRAAAGLWAALRNQGRPGAPPASLDGDVLLAAQARSEDAAIVTANPGHFRDLCDVLTLAELHPNL
ncbi:MAG: PIN domain-containing protein [Sandaracinaceae bacterium]|nr:MAG: PIN domain-containing protein [Sandaracinaceae bacterium]